VKQRIVGQLVWVTLASLSRHDDALRENFPCGRSVRFFGKWRAAGLKLRPSVIEGGNQNLHFPREKDAVGKSLDKTVHRDPPELSAQAAARIFKSQKTELSAQFFCKCVEGDTRRRAARSTVCLA
jgi:hypothetical protein